MRATSVLGLGLGLGTVLMTAACGSSGGSSGPDAPITSYDCADDTRGETYVSGLEKPGGAGVFDFKLMEATPAPPLRGNNSWVLEIDAMTNGVAGAPVSGLASGMTATPYMPDHHHGSSIEVQITPVDGHDGQYTLDPVNLWMPGLWQTTITATQGSTTDKVVYSFCLSS